jgi:hypothetical protein
MSRATETPRTRPFADKQVVEPDCDARDTVP